MSWVRAVIFFGSPLHSTPSTRPTAILAAAGMVSAGMGCTRLVERRWGPAAGRRCCFPAQRSNLLVEGVYYRLVADTVRVSDNRVVEAVQ